MHPVLFRLGPLNVYSYGLFMSLAFASAVVVAFLNAGRRGVDRWFVLDISPFLFLAGFIVSRLTYVALNWPEYAGQPARIIATWEGGQSFYGGIIGGVALLVWFARRRKVDLGRLADTFAPGLALAASVGRIGCFLNGCCYGLLTSGSWGVYTRYAPGLHHPTQLYESAAYFLVFLFLLWWSKRGARVPGQLFLSFVGAYLVGRFVIEFFREGQRIYPWLSVTQAATLVIGLVAVLAYIRLARRERARPDRPPQPS